MASVKGRWARRLEAWSRVLAVMEMIMGRGNCFRIIEYVISGNPGKSG
jgi:hypothetical protein